MLKSDRVRADLLRRAERAARAAGPGMEASAVTGRHRAHASVVTDTREAMVAEATNRSLTRALDAARG